MVAGDAVDTLLRLRRSAKDEAKRAFTARLTEEATASHAIDMLKARMWRERQIAIDLTHGDGVVEAYIAWLPAVRIQLQAAQDDYDRATTNVTLARAALTAASTAVGAAVTFLENRAIVAANKVARRSQIKLDEIAARSTKPLEP